MNTVKLYLIICISSIMLPCQSFSATPVTKHNNQNGNIIVPEKVIQTWGYRTVEIGSNYQFIKRIKPLRNSTLFPRFSLGKSCYNSEKEAIRKKDYFIKEIKNDFFEGAKSYQNFFIDSKCLYSISTNANIFYLENQPSILKKFKEFISTNNDL